MKYVVWPLHVWQSVGRRTVPKISYRVVDLGAGLNDRSYPKKTVAWSDNEAVAQQIADTLNGESGPAFGTPDELVSDHEQLRRLTHRVWKLEQAK